MNHPKLELLQLSKTYDDGNVVAVDNIDLVVEQGETLALLGPSGCGKSTTLNMIVGLEEPTSGEILVDGKSIVGAPPGQRNIGLVFQDYAVFTNMTVRKNLSFGLEIRKMAKKDIAKSVDEVAEMLGLSDMLDAKASSLGGSQLQRVAIGRTLVTKPSILLLDEPLSNLEAETRATMRRELRQLQAEIGLTIIYVTHDQIEALSLANKIAVMNAGHIRQCDKTAVVYDDPEHTFVAGFIGSPPMNLIEGKYASTDQHGAFYQGDFGIDLGDRFQALSLTDKRHITFGVRPEDVKIGRGSHRAKVVYVEPRGADAVVSLDLNGTLIKALDHASPLPVEGDEVLFDFAPESVSLFDGETRVNLLTMKEQPHV